MGLSAMLGPIVSGGLIHADLFATGWRMIFLVNIPIGIAALAHRRSASCRPSPRSAPAPGSTSRGVALAASRRC